jgi:hypothetical protein
LRAISEGSPSIRTAGSVRSRSGGSGMAMTRDSAFMPVASLSLRMSNGVTQTPKLVQHLPHLKHPPI